MLGKLCVAAEPHESHKKQSFVDSAMRQSAFPQSSEHVVTGMFCAEPTLDATMRRILGPIVVEQLGNPAIQELSANYDPVIQVCRLFVDDGSGPMRPLEATLQPAAIITATRILATLDGQSLQPAAPFLNCILANGFRYHAALPPISDGPSFSIRAHTRMLRPLSDFMTTTQAGYIQSAILNRSTILIAGGTNSGKTTLINALINLIPLTERLLIIEDAGEIQARPGNVVRRFATPGADLKRHVFESLRDRPDRIIVGEVRGAEARDMLEAAATGHSGGLSTIHANSCDEALTRLARLAQCDQQFIREAIDLVVFMKRMPNGRRAVTEINELAGNPRIKFSEEERT
jgi:Flp pilus assembly CpaF family ATPase